MQDLLAFLVIVIVAVGGAEFARASFRRRLAAPVRVQVQPETERRAVIAD
ncbi:hypothetical protein [Jatrophihabitans endophyticus]|nr:hypothetical protein [Jatrophihabitans endophyticus]MBE7190637.1 hypothetical protein [Jatrophihabitans endophyticus]